ncbi:MAG: cation-translocating P-type ATPase [Hominimerdicola sp.]
MAMQYQKPIDELYKEFGSGQNGLTTEQAVKNIEKYGKNAIAEGKKKSVPMIFLEQFKDFLVIILIIAAIVSAFAKDIESCIVILVVITMNAILGTIQTVKAEKSLSNLKKLSSPTAKVIRNGEKVVIPSEEVAVGDLLVIEAGDQICGDGRLVECASVQVNESALTGESLNIDKNTDEIKEETPLAERKNMVYSGSFVTYGRGTVLITDVGMDTEVGKIASLIQNASERQTPLQKTLDDFGKKLSIAILVICAIVFGLSLVRADVVNFDAVMDSMMFAIALAVAAIPEALSSIVTIVLSFGTQKMSKENAIIRKLQAVEGLGSVSIICSDKTGTLTQNKMTVRKIMTEGRIIDTDAVDINEDLQKVITTAMVLCNDSSCKDGVEIGDPTETALINFAAKLGLDSDKIRASLPRISEIPFDSDRKLMSTLHNIDGENVMYVKGAADVLIDRITASEEEKAVITERVAELSEKGLRILAFAQKKTTKTSIGIEDEDGLEFIGLIAMMDPPRVESKDAVYECKQAGIKPVMITGDHIVTASAIAREIGILDEGSKAVEGAELDKYSDEELKDFVKDKAVYARVTPEHKIRIVKAWQANGCIVSMTGDGVNDAPALKQADVGVAMGITGTEVSKDAAAMVLADDNFATIVKAIKNGRNIYENIKKSILFLLSGNFAGIIAVLFNSLAGLPAPFAAIHLLFINLLTDSLPAIGLGLEPHSDSVMKEKPRNANESILTRSFLGKISLWGIVIAIATIAAYLIGNKTSSEVAMTMAFATLCSARLFHGFSCKKDGAVLFSKEMFNNKFGIMAFLAGMLFLNLVLFVPGLKGLFKIAELSGMQALTIYLLSFGSMLVIQLIKFIFFSEKKGN